MLHDLNLACRYADHVVAMKGGRIVAEGAADGRHRRGVVSDVFGLQCEVVPDPISGTPMIVPRGRHHVHTMTPELTAG